MRKLSNAERKKRGTLRPGAAHKEEKDTGGYLKSVPPCPAWLPDGAQRIYNSVCADLLERGLLFTPTLDIIIVYAFEMSEYQRISEQLATEGTTYNDKDKITRLNPLIRAARGHLEAANKYSKLLCLGVYYRDKVPGKEKGTELVEHDCMMDIYARSGTKMFGWVSDLEYEEYYQAFHSGRLIKNGLPYDPRTPDEAMEKIENHEFPGRKKSEEAMEKLMDLAKKRRNGNKDN